MKIWNGRGFFDYKSKIKYDHIYICAKNKAHAIRLCEGVGYNNVTYKEINEYWSEGCWGNNMDGIEREIGIWGIIDPHCVNPKVTRLI